MSGSQRKKKGVIKKNPSGFWKKLHTSGFSCAGEPGHSWERLGEPGHWVGPVSRRSEHSQELQAIRQEMSRLHCENKWSLKKYLFLFVCVLSVCQVSV